MILSLLEYMRRDLFDVEKVQLKNSKNIHNHCWYIMTLIIPACHRSDLETEIA